MIFETIESVPEVFRDFYYETIVSELTGNILQEEYTYINEFGYECIGLRDVPEYADVHYVFLKQSNDLKTWEEVEMVVAHLGGTNDVFVKYCADKAKEKELWGYHDAYIACLEEIAIVEAKNQVIIDAFVSTPEIPEPELLPLPTLPVEPTYEYYDSWVACNCYTVDERAEITERAWRDSELLSFVDKYQNSPFMFNSLIALDQVAVYTYYDALLEYPQKDSFPYCERPVQPHLCACDELTEEQKWEARIQRELSLRRLTPIIFNNVMSGLYESEISVTMAIAPTPETVTNMTSYVAETVVNGMVEVWWDTDGGGSVQLSVQNLKPIFKAMEMYLSHLYETKKNLVASFDNRDNIDLRTSDTWPSSIINLV